MFLGRKKEDGALEVLPVYATPVYRDTSVGHFLNMKLANEGYSSLVFRQNAKGHIPYLEKVGYENRGDEGYVLDLEKLRK
jgi:hypothetical protein